MTRSSSSPCRACEIKRVHLVQGMIRGIPHHTLEHVDNGFVGRLTQSRKQGLGFAHATMLPEIRQREHPLTHHMRVVVALAGRLAYGAIGGACHSRQEARDDVAGFLLKRRWRCRSANGATGGRGWRGRLGRPCRPRCQDAQLMRSGCGGQRRRLFPDISGSQHAHLRRRYRQPLRFIARQLRRKTGSGTRNRECGGGDGKVSLLHFNSPGYDSRPQPIPLLLHCDITILHCNNAARCPQLIVRGQPVSRKAVIRSEGMRRAGQHGGNAAHIGTGT